MVKFVVFGEPIPKGSKTAYPVKTRSGKYIAVTTDANPKTKGWEHLVAQAAQDHIPERLMDGAVCMRLKFYFHRPKSVSEKKRPHHTVKPDLDKLTRSVGDALKGKIYSEDSRIVFLEAHKAYGEPQRVEIEVWGKGSGSVETGTSSGTQLLLTEDS